MKRVLLTGASGFIGQHAIAPLIARGYDIHAVSSSPRETASPSMRCHRTNLLDAAALAHLMQQIQPTHLLHFAWYAEPGGFWRSSENFRWLEASIGLLRYFRERGRPACTYTKGSGSAPRSAVNTGGTAGTTPPTMARTPGDRDQSVPSHRGGPASDGVRRVQERAAGNAKGLLCRAPIEQCMGTYLFPVRTW